MKNIKYIILAIIGLIFIASSCSDGKEINQTLEVEVENNAVTMDNSAQTKVIPVKVDKGTLFTATWDGGDWGRTELREGGFAIILDSNATFDDRTASVQVTLKDGWKNKLVNVTQKGTDNGLSVLPNEVKFDFMGGNAEIEVATLSDSWTVTSNVAWLKAIPHVKTGKILITVEENSGDKYEDVLARSSIIIVNSGSASKEILVAQGEGAYFTLPYTNFDDFTQGAVREFELARHSSIGVSNGTYDVIGTRSSLFPIIHYYLRGVGGGIELVLGRGHTHNYFETDEFKRLMELEGYEFIGVSGGGTIYNYWNEVAGRTLNSHALIRADKQGMITFFSRAKKPVIENDAPTFDEIPLLDPALTWGLSMAEVKSWEAANGGQIVHDGAYQIEYSVPGSEVYLRRIYTFEESTGGFNASLYAFKEIGKIITYKLAVPMINNNFIALLKDGGFLFDRVVGGDYMYVNKDLNLALIIGLVTDASIDYPSIVYSTPDRIGVSPQSVMPSYLYSPKGVLKIR